MSKKSINRTPFIGGQNADGPWMAFNGPMSDHYNVHDVAFRQMMLDFRFAEVYYKDNRCCVVDVFSVPFKGDGGGAAVHGRIFTEIEWSSAKANWDGSKYGKWSGNLSDHLDPDSPLTASLWRYVSSPDLEMHARTWREHAKYALGYAFNFIHWAAHDPRANPRMKTVQPGVEWEIPNYGSLTFEGQKPLYQVLDYFIHRAR